MLQAALRDGSANRQVTCEVFGRRLPNERRYGVVAGTERVLRAVELVPAGRVVSYGDLAALVGTGPRQVGSVMRHYGSNVAWWRVTNAAGEHVPHLREAAFARWADEGILLTHGGRGCRIADHRVDLVALERAWRERVADLPE